MHQNYMNRKKKHYYKPHGGFSGFIPQSVEGVERVSLFHNQWKGWNGFLYSTISGRGFFIPQSVEEVERVSLFHNQWKGWNEFLYSTIMSPTTLFNSIKCLRNLLRWPFLIQFKLTLFN